MVHLINNSHLDSTFFKRPTEFYATYKLKTLEVADRPFVDMEVENLS